MFLEKKESITKNFIRVNLIKFRKYIYVNFANILFYTEH